MSQRTNLIWKSSQLSCEPSHFLARKCRYGAARRARAVPVKWAPEQPGVFSRSSATRSSTFFSQNPRNAFENEQTRSEVRKGARARAERWPC